MDTWVSPVVFLRKHLLFNLELFFPFLVRVIDCGVELPRNVKVARLQSSSSRACLQRL